MNKNWKYGILDNAIVKDSSNLSHNKIKEDDGDYPVFGAQGFLQNVSFYQQENEYLAIIKDGAGVGRVTKHPEKSSILATMQYIIPKDGFDIDFLYYFMGYVDFDKYRTGSTIPHIYYKDYKSEVFPLIDLPEQKRIVTKLNQFFKAIDKAKTNVERNLQNAKELFQSHLSQIFLQKGKDWVEKKLGEVCTYITDGKHGDCKNEDNSGYYFLSAKDIKNGTLNYTNSRQITKEDFEETHRRTNLEPGDVLVTNSGTIGRMAIAPEDEKTYKTTFQKSVAIIKPIREIIDNKYCCYHLMADLDKLVNVSAGTAQKNLLLRDLRNHRVFIPSLNTQGKIVGNLDEISSQTKSLESHYQQELDALDELKKSILQRAFNGEL